MGNASTFDELIDLARRLGIAVRHAHLGGQGGGLARIKDARQLFVDLDADPRDQLDQTAGALAGIPEVEQMFLRPDVRALIDQYKRGDGSI
jgi:hypothetical protein